MSELASSAEAGTDRRAADATTCARRAKSLVALVARRGAQTREQMSDALASAIALSASRSKLEKQTAWNEIIPAALDEASVARKKPNLLVDAVMYQLERDDSQHVLLHAIEDICRRSDVGEAFAKALAPRIISSTA